MCTNCDTKSKIVMVCNLCFNVLCLDCGLENGGTVATFIEEYVPSSKFSTCIKCFDYFFEIQKDELKKIQVFLKEERLTKTIYPPQDEIFTAFTLTPLHKIKAVIIGQDCYHGEGQAHGLAFSVKEGTSPPPSLVNIFKELESDGFSVKNKSSGDLTAWAKQGVFLYNSSLSVEKAKPESHLKKNIWSKFSYALIKFISTHTTGVVFILWGSYAQKFKFLIDDKKHHIIESVHPSPLSSYRGFFGSKPFSKTNAFLKEKIDWSL